MAERVVPVKLLDDITECPICTESFNDPRSLPCLHTFCLACISKWSGDKLSGGNVSCPLCRKQFTISADGVTEEPKNIFIEKLIAMKVTSSSASGVPMCDWCVADPKISADKKKKAKQFCAECDKSLCEGCVVNHSNQKRCSSHRTYEIGEKVSHVPTGNLPTKCDKHPKEELKLFCIQCEEALCLICYATKHNRHKSAEIDEVAGELKKEVQRNISQLMDGDRRLSDLLSSFELERQEIIRQSEKIQAEVCSRAEQLKSIVEHHKQQLMTELTQLKNEKLKKVDFMVNDLAQNKALIVSLIRYSEELQTKGSNVDIAKDKKLMNLRVAEMRQFYDCEGAATTTRDAKYAFVPSSCTLDMSSNSIGRLDKVQCPTLCFTLPFPGNDRDVTAVTSFNNQLFVTCYDTKQIEVYDSSTFELQRLIKLPDNAGGRQDGLAVCSVYDCLYVSDWDNDKVFRVNLSASHNSATNEWPVASGPLGLSVNRSQNLLVACFGHNKVQEYSSTGKLVREIEKVACVSHAVELNDGTLVVTEGGKKSCVSIMSLKGTVLRRYPLEATAQMMKPRSIAVDKNGFILVADSYNDSLLVLNPELTNARALPLTSGTPLEKPISLCFEESRGRLYVGKESGEKRVLAFDNVYNFHTCCCEHL